MGQVVFIFSPSTLGWEEADLCEFQPSLVHIKFQARYIEGFIYLNIYIQTHRQDSKLPMGLATEA